MCVFCAWRGPILAYVRLRIKGLRGIQPNIQPIFFAHDMQENKIRSNVHVNGTNMNMSMLDF